MHAYLKQGKGKVVERYRRKEQLKLSVTRGLPYSTRIDRVRK